MPTICLASKCYISITVAMAISDKIKNKNNKTDQTCNVLELEVICGRTLTHFVSLQKPSLLCPKKLDLQCRMSYEVEYMYQSVNYFMYIDTPSDPFLTFEIIR